jgi:hypothetical protein
MNEREMNNDLSKVLTGWGLSGYGVNELVLQQIGDNGRQNRYMIIHNDMVVSKIDIALNKGTINLSFNEGCLTFRYPISAHVDNYEKLLKLESTILFTVVRDSYILPHSDDIIERRNSAIAASVLKKIKNVGIKDIPYKINYHLAKINDTTVDVTVSLISDSVTITEIVVRLSNSGTIIIDYGGQNVSYFSHIITDRMFSSSTSQIRESIVSDITKILSYYLTAYNE